MISSATSYTITKNLLLDNNVPVDFDDGTSAGVMYVNGALNGASVTLTNLATGLYKAAFTTPTLSNGDHVGVYATGDVDGISVSLEFLNDFCSASSQTVLSTPTASTAMTSYQTACSNCATAIGNSSWREAMRYYAQASAYLAAMYVETSKDGAAVKMRETLDGLKRAIDAGALADAQQNELTRFVGLGTAFS